MNVISKLRSDILSLNVNDDFDVSYETSQILTTFKIISKKTFKIDLCYVDDLGNVVYICNSFYIRGGCYVHIHQDTNTLTFSNFKFEILNEYNINFLNDDNLVFKIRY